MELKYVYLLLGIKNTRIQRTLLRVLPSRVGVYLSPFKEVWGSRIILIGSNKAFSQANKEQLKDSNHAVYAFDTREQMIEANESMHKKRD